MIAGTVRLARAATMKAIPEKVGLFETLCPLFAPAYDNGKANRDECGASADIVREWAR
jgi:hypothetical protein